MKNLVQAHRTQWFENADQNQRPKIGMFFISLRQIVTSHSQEAYVINLNSLITHLMVPKTTSFTDYWIIDQFILGTS